MQVPLGFDHPELAADEVHLWWGRADQDPLSPLHSGRPGPLSSAELERAERFVAPEHGRRFRARRAFLRRVLAAYTGADPAELDFAVGVHGKPRLAAGELTFSLSRTEDLILLAVTRGREVGVDVEAPRSTSDVARLARRVLSARELEEFQVLSEPERSRAFFRLWVRKEAALKLTGEGLSRDPRTLELGLEAHAVGELWCPPDEPLLAGHALCDLADSVDEPAACLCAAGSTWRVVQVRPRASGRAD